MPSGRMLQGQEAALAEGQCLGETCCWWDTCEVVKRWFARVVESSPALRAHLQRNRVLEEMTGGDR